MPGCDFEQAIKKSGFGTGTFAEKKRHLKFINLSF
jgi:hypothetical protein